MSTCMSKVRGTKKRGDISRSTTRRTNPCIGLAVSQDPRPPGASDWAQSGGLRDSRVTVPAQGTFLVLYTLLDR